MVHKWKSYCSNWSNFRSFDCGYSHNSGLSRWVADLLDGSDLGVGYTLPQWARRVRLPGMGKLDLSI